jgi:NADH:ubiquinone oxidoreductase subunit D
VGVISKEDAIAYGLSGPNLRSSGVDHDLRKKHPYLDYQNYDFDVPIGTNGDVYDRYLIRVEEIRQSVKILRQLADKCPTSGPTWVDDKRVRIPAKERVHNSMEALIHHFKFFMEGFDMPPGEAYSQTEGPNGEVGFYIISRGGPKAARMRIRAPSFYMFQGVDEMIKGQMIGDLVAAVGSVNIIAGELDR